MSNDREGLRENIPVEKGVVIGEKFLIDNEELIQDYCNYFLLYPDLFFFFFKTKNCPITLFFYQRMLLRAMMRYRYVFGTFTRGLNLAPLFSNK